MGKLSHKEKLRITRDIMLRKPDVGSYGYNRRAIAMFRDQFDIRVDDPEMSKLIREVQLQWRETKERIITKKQIIDMFINIYENSDKAISKIRSLEQIGKLEGFYEEKITIKDDISNGELKALAQKIIDKKIKENNGKSSIKRRKNSAEK